MSENENVIPYLDKGYVRHVASNGDDELIATFARASFDEDAYQDPDKNRNLINHLVDEEHTSPIEAGELIFQFKLPLFVRDQLVRHRTASMNIQSLRYSKHDGDYYIPELDRFRQQGKWNKQESGDLMQEDDAVLSREYMILHSKMCYSVYERLIGWGLSRETARLVIPTNFFVTMAWKCDTKNLMHFLRLRDDPHAQWEIRQLAKIISSFFERDFPMTYAAYEEFIKHSRKVARTELEILRELLADVTDEKIDQMCSDRKIGVRRTRKLKELIRG